MTTSEFIGNIYKLTNYQQDSPLLDVVRDELDKYILIPKPKYAIKINVNDLNEYIQGMFQDTMAFYNDSWRLEDEAEAVKAFEFYNMFCTLNDIKREHIRTELTTKERLGELLEYYYERIGFLNRELERLANESDDIKTEYHKKLNEE